MIKRDQRIHFLFQLGIFLTVRLMILSQVITVVMFLTHLCWLVLQGKQLAELLGEDPALMERRQKCAKRLELYKSARDEIDSVSWAS